MQSIDATRSSSAGVADVWPARDEEPAAILRATIEAAPIGIAQFDAEGRFLLVNAQLCNMLGYTREELVARRYQDISAPEDVAACVAANAQLVAGAIPSYRLTKRFIRGDGSEILVRVTVKAMHVTPDEPSLFVAVAEEVGEEDESTLAMERLLALEHEARTRAEHATRMRDEVLAIVAHDLRNPLHTIQLAASSLLEADSSVARVRDVGIIQQVVESMDRLIGDLLDIARIDSGSFSVRKTEVAISELLDEVMRMQEPQVRAHRITLVREDASELGVVSCDRDQLMRALVNLIGNAIKFTPADGRIVLRSTREGAMLHISVEDTGPGIPPEDLPHVFDRFWQSSSTNARGVGLGLMIARGVIESHGGRIWVQSSVGRGSSFHVELPI